MTSRPLKSLTKPNLNYGPANWTNFGPDRPKYGPNLSQAHGTLIVTDYPPAYPPYLSPIPSIFVTNTTNISVETNICHQCHQYICGDKYEVCSSTSNRTVILTSFSFLTSLNKELLLQKK